MKDTEYLTIKRALRASIDARPSYEDLRDSRLRDLRRLAHNIRAIATDIAKSASYEKWLHLCMLTRLYALFFLDRWITLNGEWYRETCRDFLTSVESALPLVEVVIASAQSEDERHTTRSYYRNMEARLNLLLLFDQHRIEEVYTSLWSGLELAPVNHPSIDKIENSLAGEDVMPTVFYAAAARALTHKLLHLAFELRHEVGPFERALEDHVTFVESALNIHALLLNLASDETRSAASSANLHDLHSRGTQLAEDVVTWILTPLNETIADSPTSGANPGGLSISPETAAFTLIRSLEKRIEPLILRADQDWKRLVAQLPDEAWRAWITLGAEDFGMLPPEIESIAQADGAGEQFVQVLQHLPDITDYSVLESWLLLVKKYGFENQTGVSADDNALHLITRMIRLSFAASKSDIADLILTYRDTFIRGSFPLSVMGLIIAYFEGKPIVTEDDRRWVDDLLESVSATDARTFGSQQAKEALMASLFSLAFYIGANTRATAVRFRKRLEHLVNREIEVATRPYFLQFLADNLSRLVPLSCTQEHSRKLPALMPILSPSNIPRPNVPIYLSIIEAQTIPQSDDDAAIA